MSEDWEWLEDMAVLVVIVVVIVVTVVLAGGVYWIYSRS